MIWKFALAGLIVVALATPVRAGRDVTDSDSAEPRDIDNGDRHVAAAVAWAGLELALPAWYYWHTKADQVVDWTRPSWKDKVTLRAVRFDTNGFFTNGIRHPFAGAGDYQIARSNGFGMLESTLFAYLAGVVWEFLIEYYEDPSLNDLIMNGAAGLAIGEPFYQVGQLWRGAEPSPLERMYTAAFSPFAVTQDLWRSHRSWQRQKAFRDFAFTVGAVGHRLDDGTSRHELALGAGVDVVHHPGFVVPGAHAGWIAPGAWSRIAFGLRLSDSGAGTQLAAVTLRTHTTITGTYTQDDAGNGRLLALGTAFTYRRTQLAHELDHVAIAHLLGPQLQLSKRGGETELRWDLAAYADFGLIDAHVFGPKSPLPPPPPYLSTLQAQGYYDAGGVSIESRVHANHGAWHADLELTGHRLWSLDFADRVQPTADISRAAATATPAIPATPHGVSDLRAYGHAEIGVRSGPWGVAATADVVLRHGSWRDLARTTSDWALGAVATANF
ncbi:MAG TPA: DUF3943 domain-containing protein [Kofleriaceae bacterium]|jgi:hypothetical protein|nr:DUF3943 domain-containing protein [Kofleriaceae bacterium]